MMLGMRMDLGRRKSDPVGTVYNFDATGVWTPNFTGTVLVEAVGPGGDGESSTSTDTAGAGGWGGSYTSGSFSTVASTPVTITVDANSTSYGSSLVIGKGVSGISVNTGSGRVDHSGGAGGSTAGVGGFGGGGGGGGCGGPTTDGDPGANGDTFGPGSGGVNRWIGGQGGNGGFEGNAGLNGDSYGGGGGGAGAGGGVIEPIPGGLGANGFLRITRTA